MTKVFSFGEQVLIDIDKKKLKSEHNNALWKNREFLVGKIKYKTRTNVNKKVFLIFVVV